jgi:hypothetical protein
MRFNKHTMIEVIKEQAPNLLFIACMLVIGIMTSAIKPH